jgi:hypothetical protein
MNNIEPLLLNVKFKYKYIDDEFDGYKEEIEDFNIINNGVFNMKNIRNINFYDELVNSLKETKNTEPDTSGYEISDKKNLKDKLKKKLKIDNESNDTINNDNDYDVNFTIKLPFSKNYITKENLDLVVSEKVKNDSQITNDIEVILNFYIDKKEVLDELIEQENFKNKKFNIKINNFFNILKKKDPIENHLKSIKDINTDYLNYEKLFKILDKLIEHKQSDIFYKYTTPSNRPLYNENMQTVKESLQVLESELNKNDNIFNQFKNKNYKHFFTNDNVIKEYFEELETNFDKNIAYDSKYNNKENRYGSIKSDDIPLKLNTKEEFINILYEYGKYIVSEEEYKKYKNKKDFYNAYISQELIIKKIITYYNAYTILNDIYLIQNTIIFNNYYDKVKMKGSQYKYIKKIKCIPQLLHIKMKNNNILNVYFDLEYENINEYNIINFFINFIDVENYTSKDLNKKENNYINYKTKIFSDKTNIINEIYISKHINYKKLIKDFKILNRDNPIFKKESIENIQEALINEKISFSLNSGYKFINYRIEDEKNYENNFIDFIENIFMKEIFLKENNLLFVNNKYYTISKIEFNKNIIESKIKSENAIKSEEIKSDNFIIYDNQDIRLYVSDVNTRINTYLNVFCYIKNSKDEKITFNNKFNSILNCNNNANNLDLLFKKILGEYYDNYFKKLLTSNKHTDTNTKIKTFENIKEETENKEKLKEKEFLNMNPKIGENKYLSKGGKKKYKLYKKNKIHNYEKKFKKNKRKKSFNNKFKKIQNKTIKLIKLYLKN